MSLFRSLRASRLRLMTSRNIVLRTAPRTAPALIRPFMRTTPQRLLVSIRFKTTSAANEAVSKSAAQPPNPSMKIPILGNPARSHDTHCILAYGPKLCVYHAGTGKITFLACLKLTTLFVFAFFGFVVTPAYYRKEGLSPIVVRTSLCAVVPLVFVAYTTSPFVMFIHMRLPPFARQSEDILRRYVRTLSPQTELEITTMSFISKPRVSMVKLSELSPVNKRLGIVNMTRDTAVENAARKWYRFRAIGNFNVQRESGTIRAPWAWETIWNHVNARRL
ncbi:hypothetical protein O1611_g7140 [Lasiodiplodia mahajangana]|uniref:Uncharacterized protein n=1 Tax=Lasiodiplodia mahajangana TaxID=1108764 RepID=A0ACC2JGI7_9PEZI|nr:hypothetical protein O1611_g7140 [Lasiodiplodia mahajangana]